MDCLDILGLYVGFRMVVFFTCFCYFFMFGFCLYVCFCFGSDMGLCVFVDVVSIVFAVLMGFVWFVLCFVVSILLGCFVGECG